MAEAEVDMEGGSELEAAKDFFMELLANGPVATKRVKADANGACHAWRTIERAKRALGIVAEKSPAALGGYWIWRLPTNSATPQQERQSKNMAALAVLPPDNPQNDQDRQHRHEKRVAESNDAGGVKPGYVDSAVVMSLSTAEEK